MTPNINCMQLNNVQFLTLYQHAWRLVEWICTIYNGLSLPGSGISALLLHVSEWLLYSWSFEHNSYYMQWPAKTGQWPVKFTHWLAKCPAISDKLFLTLHTGGYILQWWKNFPILDGNYTRVCMISGINIVHVNNNTDYNTYDDYAYFRTKHAHTCTHHVLTHHVCSHMVCASSPFTKLTISLLMFSNMESNPPNSCPPKRPPPNGIIDLEAKGSDHKDSSFPACREIWHIHVYTSSTTPNNTTYCTVSMSQMSIIKVLSLRCPMSIIKVLSLRCPMSIIKVLSLRCQMSIIKVPNVYH